jgi:hypothetical protein
MIQLVDPLSLSKSETPWLVRGPSGWGCRDAELTLCECMLSSFPAG